MSTKSRSSLFQGAYSGATIRKQSAEEKLAKAQREADVAAAEEWSIRLQFHGGPAQPSPTIAQCLNSDYEWLQVECRRCRHEAQVPLREVRRKRDTPIWKLEAALRCERCRDRRYAPPVRLVKLNKTAERATSGCKGGGQT
jgi:hypothetical protein